MHLPAEASAPNGNAVVPLGRTVAVSILLAFISFLATQWITHDFQVWTTEGARRLEVALHPVPAPPIGAEGPAIDRGSTLRDLLALDGVPTIVDFMYTRCVTVCTTLGSVFQQLQADILQAETPGKDAPSHDAAVRLLSLSFDPAHDTPAVLAAYSTLLHADPRIWRFARVKEAAPEDETQKLLRLYRTTVIPDGLGGYEHNAALLVMDSRGRLLRIFDYGEREMALAFALSLPSPVPSPGPR